MILGFKPDFVPLIISGTKVHTIRAGSRWVAGQPISFCINFGPDNLSRFQPDGIAQTVQAIRAEKIHTIYLVEIDGHQLPTKKTTGGPVVGPIKPRILQCLYDTVKA